MYKLLFALLLASLLVHTSSAQFIKLKNKDKKAGNTPKGILIFSDEFNTFDTSLWVVEMSPQPDSKVGIKSGQLLLDTKGGVTVWLKKKLQGNIRIEYTRKVLVDTGRNDRLSDLNNFWMATDPRNPNLFTRDGLLESYDSLKMYYVGMGGNSNSTTRFRKYQGTGERTLIREHIDSEHLLHANKNYHITITVNGNITTFAVNGKVFFNYNDPVILKEGYFGFRSTKSRQVIDHIKVYQLP